MMQRDIVLESLLVQCACIVSLSRIGLCQVKYIPDSFLSTKRLRSQHISAKNSLATPYSVLTIKVLTPSSFQLVFLTLSIITQNYLPYLSLQSYAFLSSFFIHQGSTPVLTISGKPFSIYFRQVELSASSFYSYSMYLSSSQS